MDVQLEQKIRDILNRPVMDEREMEVHVYEGREGSIDVIILSPSFSFHGTKTGDLWDKSKWIHDKLFYGLLKEEGPRKISVWVGSSDSKYLAGLNHVGSGSFETRGVDWWPGLI